MRFKRKKTLGLLAAAFMVAASCVVNAPAANAAVGTCGPNMYVLPSSPGSGELEVMCGLYEGLDTYVVAQGETLPGRRELRNGHLLWVVDYTCLAPGTVVRFGLNNPDGSLYGEFGSVVIPNTGKLPEECGTPSAFLDVSPGQAFYNEMVWLSTQGISTGWEDGSYRPLQPINRDAMAAFLYRAASDEHKKFTNFPQVSPFADVSSSQQFYMEMAWLADKKITEGWKNPDGSVSFRPLTPINRDAMAAFLYRDAGSPEFTPPATSPFTDVAVGQQFYKEMAWLAASGISTGWDNGNGTKSFQPTTPINRDAMAAFLYRYAHLK